MENTKLVFVGIFSVLFLAALDQTIIATALPRIVEGLHGTTLYVWVATSYLLTSTVALPIFGRFIEIYEGRKVVLSATIIFMVGSALSGLFSNMVMLIFFRSMQGIGAGGQLSIVLSILGLQFTPRERGKHQGYFGSVFGISSIIGPLLGGLTTDNISWYAEIDKDAA